MSLPLRLPWSAAEDRWASEIDPVLAMPPIQGVLLGTIALKAGVNMINHRLQRMQQGWIIYDQDGASSIYRTAALNNLTLTLTSTAACNVKLWVF